MIADAEPVNGVIECDVAVVGGGPAGIAAATRAAEMGSRVLLMDRGLRPGGQIWRHRETSELPALARQWLARCARSGACWMGEAHVVDGSPGGALVVTQRGRSFTVRASAVVLATGARELFLPYPGWTLPNVMGVGGVQALLKSGAEVRGRRVVIAGSGPLLLPVAALMARSGAVLVAVAEQAPSSRVAAFAAGLWAHPSRLMQAVAYRAAFAGTSYYTGTWIEDVVGDAAEARVECVTLTNGRRRWVEACDLLCCSFGLVPSTELASLLGCDSKQGRVVVDHLQRTTVANVFCAGESTGVGGALAALVEGEIAGLAAAGHPASAAARRLQRSRDAWRRWAERLAHTFEPREALRSLAHDDTIVCRCEDVRRSQLDPSWSARQAKLYTRLGMGPCQGAVCGAACQTLFGWQANTVRPPLGAPSVADWMADEA
jgi:thioredoxin reductase